MNPRQPYRLLLALAIPLLLLLAGCGGGGAGTASAPADTALPNVLLVGWDGAQRDHVRQLLHAGRLPRLQALAAAGALVNATVTTGATDTKAGWAEILTGYSPERTGVWSNDVFGAIPAGYTIPERLRTAYGSRVATIAAIAKRGHLNAEVPGDLYYTMRQTMDFYANGLHDTDLVTETAMAQLEQYRTRPFFCFVHYGQADNDGHYFGENSAAYTRELIACDRGTGRLLDKLSELGLAEATLVYVTADHGFDEGEEVHFTAPWVFLATNDPLVTRAGDRKDVAPTILRRYGLDGATFTPPLDGRPL